MNEILVSRKKDAMLLYNFFEVLTGKSYGSIIKTFLKATFPFGILLGLTSCSHRKLSREEWIKVTQRNFHDVEKDYLISKAQEVLILADGEDFQFAHSQDGFSASRKWSTYLVFAAAFGTDYWSFQVVPSNDGQLIAKLSVSTVAGTVSGYSTGYGASTVTIPGQGAPVDGNAVYEIFWHRLNYLLGKSDQWMDCILAAKKQSTKEFFGNDEALCNSFNLNSSYPMDLSDSEIERLSKDRKGFKKNYLSKREKKNR